MIGKHILVSGKVQGVGFRFHAHEQARSLGILGWIRNLDNGKVEAVAFGSRSAMESFINWMTEGPPKAKVQNFEQQDLDVSQCHFKDFSIRRDGGPTWSAKE